MGRGSYFNSTSGLLCLSTICDPKFSRHMAACMVARTQAKYGLLAVDYNIHQYNISALKYIYIIFSCHMGVGRWMERKEKKLYS